MKHYLKNTPLLTLSLTALILTSTADVAQSSNRYNSYDDAPYEIDSTDEFNSYFSFFDGDDDSSSFSPSEESYSEKSTKRKRDFGQEEAQEENNEKEEAIEDVNDTSLKKMKTTYLPNISDAPNGVRSLVFLELDCNSSFALSSTCKAFNKTFREPHIQREMIRRKAKKLFQVYDDDNQDFLETQSLSNAIYALPPKKGSAQHFHALCQDPIFSIDIHSKDRWKKEEAKDSNNAYLKQAILYELSRFFIKGNKENTQKLFLIARYASQFFSPEENILGDDRVRCLLEFSEEELITLGDNMPLFTQGFIDEGVHNNILGSLFERGPTSEDIQQLGEVINNQLQNLFPQGMCTDVMYSLLLNCTPEQIDFIGSKAVTFFGANESEQHDIEAEWKASLIEALGLCSIEQLQAIANNADQYFIDNFETEADPDTHEDYEKRGDIVELLSDLSVEKIDSLALSIKSGFLADLDDATNRKIDFIKERKEWVINNNNNNE